MSFVTFFSNYSSLGGTPKQTTVDAKWRVLARRESALLKYAWHTLELSFDGYSDVLDLELPEVVVKQEVIDLGQEEEEVIVEGGEGVSKQTEGNEDFVLHGGRRMAPYWHCYHLRPILAPCPALHIIVYS